MLSVRGEAEKATVSPCSPSGRKKQLLAVMPRLMCPVVLAVRERQTAREVFSKQLTKIAPSCRGNGLSFEDRLPSA